MTFAELKKLNIPALPGIYFFKDQKGTVLYIGKATLLKERLRSYFASDLIETRGPHIVDMVFKAKTVTWIECTNALEALILEAGEIKRHKPYYNTKEKDDKSFNCIVITKEEFPRVLLVRQKDISYKKTNSQKSRTQTTKIQKASSQTERPYSARHRNQTVIVDALYGPFPSGTAIKEAIKIVRRIFPFRDSLSVQKDKEVFYRQIGLSPDLSAKDAKQKYKETIHQIKLFFGGKFAELRKEINKKMNESAKTMYFESANEFKKKLFALDHIQDISLLKRENLTKYSGQGFRIEAYDVAHLSGKNMVGVMTVCIGGNLVKHEYKKFVVRSVSGANDPAALKEILSRRLAHNEWGGPDLIVVDGNDVQKSTAEKVLKEFSIKDFAGENFKMTKQIPVVAVVKDDKHRARAILGEKGIIEKYKLDILLANNDAHRFAITFYKKTANKKFINGTK